MEINQSYTEPLYKRQKSGMSVYDQFFTSNSSKEDEARNETARPQTSRSFTFTSSNSQSYCSNVLTDKEHYKNLIEKFKSGTNSTPLSKFSDRITRPDECVSFNISVINSNETKLQDLSDLEILKVQMPTTSKPSASSTNRFASLVAQSPYLNSNWLTQFQDKYSKRDQLITQQTQREIEKSEFWRQRREIAQTSEIRSLSNRLNLLLKEPGVVEDVEPEPEPKPEPLPELTPEVVSGIKEVMSIRNAAQVVSNAFRLEITRADLETLTGRNWLSDNIINFYMQLISHRSTSDISTKLPKVAVLTTFFYPKLKQSGFSSVKRWTRKSELFNHDLVMIPIHLGVHWCLSCIDMKRKEIRYYDSMGGHNYECLSILLRFLEEESMDKLSQKLDTASWKVEIPENIPQQENGFDCGVFSCCFAEFLSRNREVTFSQKDMPYFRQRFIYEIYRQKLL